MKSWKPSFVSLSFIKKEDRDILRRAETDQHKQLWKCCWHIQQICVYNTVTERYIFKLCITIIMTLNLRCMWIWSCRSIFTVSSEDLQVDGCLWVSCSSTLHHLCVSDSQTHMSVHTSTISSSSSPFPTSSAHGADLKKTQIAYNAQMVCLEI